MSLVRHVGFPNEAKSSCMTSVEVLHPKACWPLGRVFSDVFILGGSACLTLVDCIQMHF